MLQELLDLVFKQSPNWRVLPHWRKSSLGRLALASDKRLRLPPLVGDQTAALDGYKVGYQRRRRRVSIWLFVVNFNFIFSIGQRFRAGRYKISHLQQYLPVVGNFYEQYSDNNIWSFIFI
jgi:hypothetical protein